MHQYLCISSRMSSCTSFKQCTKEQYLHISTNGSANTCPMSTFNNEGSPSKYCLTHCICQYLICYISSGYVTNIPCCFSSGTEVMFVYVCSCQCRGNYKNYHLAEYECECLFRTTNVMKLCTTHTNLQTRTTLLHKYNVLHATTIMCRNDELITGLLSNNKTQIFQPSGILQLSVELHCRINANSSNTFPKLYLGC